MEIDCKLLNRKIAWAGLNIGRTNREFQNKIDCILGEGKGGEEEEPICHEMAVRQTKDCDGLNQEVRGELKVGTAHTFSSVL